MSVGVVRQGQWASAVAKGIGNTVMIVGSSTGRDGIHGATFASEEISEESEAKRPSVQVGDPFTEKLLLEATLEAIRSGNIVGIQDMGAAGITCSTSEMAAKGKSGMRIDLDRVPARETGMSAYELMLSESQERMLVVVKKGEEEKVQAIFRKWDLHAEIIGEITAGDSLEVTYRGSTVANVPADSLVLGGGAPVYVREAREPEYLKMTRAFDSASLPLPNDLNAVLLAMLRSPNIASKRWVYEQYDSMVRTNNICLARSDAAVVLIKEALIALSMKTDCNARYVYLNPRVGGRIAVAEAARNVVCTGATPVAITNCLNFGNPYKPEVYWQFREAVAGIGEACRAFDTPVTGGNVSFYNESPVASVYPTPVIGMLGIIEDLDWITEMPFRNPGEQIILLGKNRGEIGGSEYLNLIHGKSVGQPPFMDLEQERRLHRACLRTIRDGLVSSAHDCSEGGLAVALAECCVSNNDAHMGARVSIDSDALRPDFMLFGEDQSRIVISAPATNAEKILAIASEEGVASEVIGTVGGHRLTIGSLIDLEVGEMAEGYLRSIEEAVSLETF
jgi:phosphoribosylformylglycinamidine synthase